MCVCVCVCEIEENSTTVIVPLKIHFNKFLIPASSDGKHAFFGSEIGKYNFPYIYIYKERKWERKGRKSKRERKEEEKKRRRIRKIRKRSEFFFRNTLKRHIIIDIH